MTEELKPCPFCGGEARHNSEGIVECCFCGGIFDGSPDGWNRRTPEPNTSVIRWTRYDGTVETLPDVKVLVSCCSLSSKEPVLAEYGYDGYDLVWNLSDKSDVMLNIGDLWAYIPTPDGMSFYIKEPEGNENAVAD